MLINRRYAIAGAAAAAAMQGGAAADPSLQARHHGVVMRTPDLDAALAFFGDGMGFAIADIRGREGWARLASNLPIYLEAVSGGRTPQPGEAGVEITFQSNNLEQSIPVLRGAGARVLTDTPYEVAVGRSIRFLDNAGVVHHMLQASRAAPVFAEPRVYNTGFEVPQAAIAPVRAILEQGLGFAPMTERYFPPSVPYLEAEGSFAFMLHHNQPFEPDHIARAAPAATDHGPAQIFVVSDLPAASAAVAALGAAALDAEPRAFAYGRRRAFATPGGAPFELWRWE